MAATGLWGQAKAPEVGLPADSSSHWHRYVSSAKRTELRNIRNAHSLFCHSHAHASLVRPDVKIQVMRPGQWLLHGQPFLWMDPILNHTKPSGYLQEISGYRPYFPSLALVQGGGAG